LSDINEKDYFCRTLMISDIKTIEASSLNSEGRLQETNTKTYNSINASVSDWLHSETKTLTYNTINFVGSQKITVPTQVLTTQQYQNSNVVLVDTVSYGYYSPASRGRLQWMRTGNKDGTITTSYEYLNPAGVCNKKTASTPGCAPRIETYTYDNTGRFVLKIKNPDFPNLESNFTYDTKTGNKLTETDANNLTTTYIYDHFGRLKQINHPDGTKTETIVNWYSSSSLPNAKYTTKTTTTGMPELIIYYDILGREVARKEDDYYYKTIYNSKGQVEKTIGYLAGLTSAETTGIIHNYTYDNLGRVKTETQTPYTDLTYTYDKRKVTVTDNLRKTSSYKNYDALGRITVAQDLGGAISYAYAVISNSTTGNKPQHRTIISANGAETKIFSNLWGNRLSIVEPNAGEIKSEYNNFGELVAQTDANGNITQYQYDVLGRVTQKKFIGTDNFAAKYVYDNATGKLNEIRQNSNDALIYRVHYRNKFNETTRCEYGNEVITDYTYNKYGILTRINTGNKYYTNTNQDTLGMDEPHSYDRGIPYSTYAVDSSILNYRYTYNDLGLMGSRFETVANIKEEFKYDDLDRLIKVIPNTGATQTFSYYSNGNIHSNSFIGTYNYLSPKPHAVTKIVSPNSSVISTIQCDVTYNFFNQPTEITEGNCKINLSYGANMQRNKAVSCYNNVPENTHYYVNKYYEKEIDANNVTKEYNYIYAGGKVVAMRITARGVNEIYYIHTDHLGSYCAITDAARQVKQRNYFDAWGNAVIWLYRNGEIDNADTTRKPQPINFALTNRGFTGHEHYPQFKIINMNGRLYDPVIGRFFSPDKYVANSSFTQDFNRYTYARNNPLAYVDPDGEYLWVIPVVIGVAMGAIQGRIVAQKSGATGWNAAGYIIGGAAIGGLSGLASYGMGVGIAGAGLGIIGGNIFAGAISGLTGGVINGAVLTSLAGGSKKEIYNSTLFSGLIGMGIGAGMGAITGVIEYGRLNSIFLKGCKELGINPRSPIAQELRKDWFLAKAKSVWFKDAPDGGGDFSTEKIPARVLSDMNRENANAATVAHFGSDSYSTGGSDVYFHPDRAFTSARKLFSAMGHELVHVSQYLSLAGSITNVDLQMNNFINMLESLAHNFSNKIGGSYWHANFNQDWLNSHLGYYFEYLTTNKTSWQFNFRP